MERSYLEMFTKIKLAAPEMLHLNTVLYATEDNLPYILGLLLAKELYHKNFCIKPFPATSTSRYGPEKLAMTQISYQSLF